MKKYGSTSVFLALSLAACSGNDTGLRSLQPELSIAPPAPLAFGEVVVGEPASLDVFVTNAGRAELVVTLSVTAEDEDDDVFSVNGEEILLAPDDSFTVPVTFAPEAFVPYEATLVFTSNDPEQPLFGFAMTGTGRPVPVPDIGLCAEVIDFGDVAAGTTTDQICLITNDGETDLELGAVVQSGSGAFSLVTDPSNAVVAPGSSLPVILRYSPAVGSGDTAELRFPSNDADEPEVLVQLLGNGGGSATYPQASILWGEPATAPDAPCPATVSPVADLPLSGETSTDPLGGGLSYLWTVTDTPVGAQGGFANPTAETTTLHVDAAGDWSVQLQVASEDGTLSAPARCLITAVPSEDVRVELSWDGPTSDLDLHLADGVDTPLYDVPGDVSPCNPAPAWGGALDQDDADGLGPESILVDDAADGTYPVRVHYFARNADFSVTATVRVYLDGVLAFNGSTALDYNEVWEVGQINWPAATFGVSGGNPRLAESRQCD